jgi:hypothetical protein
MKDLLISFLALALSSSGAFASENSWVRVNDDRIIERFMQKDQNWADTLMRAMGGSGSGGLTGMQIFMMGGSGSGGLTGGHHLFHGGSGGGGVLPGIYVIDSQETFNNLSDIGIAPNQITGDEFYKVLSSDGIEQMGYFTGREWIVSN